MPATKVGKIQSARYRRAANNSIIKPTKQSNTDRCIDYIEDVKGDKKLNQNLDIIKSESEENQEYLINYAFNQHKCYDNVTQAMLRTAINCSSVENAKYEFKNDENAYYSVKIESGNSKNINKAFHIINSFKGHAVPAAKVHAIGEEFARRLVGNSFKAVVSTHTNTDHYHNHIVINAYAADGAYKFKDSWNLGLQLQRIANELSLENGIEIISERMESNSFELDEDKLTFSNIRDKKMYKKGSYKHHIISDILLTAKSTTNWNDYVLQMQKKGYKIKYNKKSITYFNEKFGAIRDNRLGFQFTKQYIEKFFDEKQELDDLSKFKVNINIKRIYIPKYIGTGKNSIRIPAILRLIQFIIRVFTEIINAEPQIIQKTDNDYIINIKKQLNNLVKTENLLKKYEINNFTTLKIKKNQILKEYVTLNNLYKSIGQTKKSYKKLEDAIRNYNEYKSDIEKIGITKEDMKIYDIGTVDILENKAKLNPMTPNTKSRLYKALNKSGYILKYTFNQITENEAKEICYFLANQNKQSEPTSSNFVRPVNKKLPDTLYTLKEYMQLKKANKLPIYSRTPKENRFLTLNFDELYSKYNVLNENKELYGFKTAISLYRDAILTLNSYGLNTDEQISDFKLNNIDIVKNNYSNISEKLSELKNQLNDISYIESFYNGNYENIYKPIKTLTEQQIVENSIKTLVRENESSIEQLICLKKILNEIDLSILDDENVIIAPIDILTATEIILMVQGEDKSIEDLMKLTKSELKNIITDFVNHNNIDKMIESEQAFEKTNYQHQKVEEQKTNNSDTKDIKKEEFEKE